MSTDAQHVAPVDPRKRRRTTRVVLGAALATALGASVIYLANADAGETAVPGRLQAEAYSAQSGAKTENTTDAGGGKDVGWLADGDWLEYKNVTVAGRDLAARIASQNSTGGSIELRLGSRTGKLLATFPVASTGGWQKWKSVPVKAASVPAGKQTVFLVMRSKSRSDFVNINYLTLGTAATPPPASSAAVPPPATSSAATSSAAPSSAAPSSAAPSSAAPSASAWGSGIRLRATSRARERPREDSSSIFPAR